MKIPDDIYYRVLDLASALVNASESLDRANYSSRYDELRGLCERESASGRAHPFLLETLADFTDDDAVAIELYKQGLDMAVVPEAAAHRASIQFALAERYKAMGDEALSYQYAAAADEAASTLDDLELRRSISEFLASARMPTGRAST